MSALIESSPPRARDGIFAAASLFMTCVWITLSLRIWVRVTIIKSPGWDDATLLFAAVIFTGYCVVVIMVETVGGASHVQDLSLPELSQLVSLTVASFELYITAMIFFKISLGIFYLRFVIRPWERYAVYATMIMSTGYGIFLFFIALLNCGNPADYLDNELKQICMTKDSLYGIQLVGALVNALTDWVLAILPIFILVKASMPTKAKVSAGAVLLLGCIGSVISLIRIQYMKGLLPGPNFFRTAVDLCIWSIIECGLGISAAAAATLRPLFRSLRENTNVFLSFGSRSKSALDSMNQTRLTDTMFGDWGYEPSQQGRDPRDNESRTHFSITPILKNSRVMSKMGISRQTITQQTPLTAAPTAPSAPGHVRQTSDRIKSRPSRVDNLPTQRPEMVRQPSVREKGISRPIPHIASQAAPPTPTGQNQQELIRIDHRRHGSLNWVPRSKPPARRSSNPYFDSPYTYYTPTPTSPVEGRPF